MSKGIVFTNSQVKAFENGATMFIFPCKHTEFEIIALNDNFYHENYAPIQKGDKKVFIQEEFVHHFDPMFQACGDIFYKAEEPDIMSEWTPANEMPKKHSRYTIIKCIDVRVVRVQDIKPDEWYRIGCKLKVIKQTVLKQFEEFYNNQLKEANINRTYEDNDYVFLIEIKNER